MNKRSKIIIGAILLIVLVISAIFITRRTSLRHRELLYEELIMKTSQKYKVRPTLIKALILRESKYREKVRGKAGEFGLMQIMKPVADDWSRAQRYKHFGNYEQLLDAEINIEVGTWYLAKALRKWKDYKDCDILALAQYNAGPGTVLRKKWVPSHKSGSAMNLISFRGTKSYIIYILDKEKEYLEREKP